MDGGDGRGSLGQYPFCFFFRVFSAFFLAEHRRLRCESAPAYATFRCFCFQFCSFFGGQICFKEAIMLVKYATLGLLRCDDSPFPFHLYVLFTPHFRLIYSGLAFFFCRVHNVVFNAFIYASMHVKYTFVCRSPQSAIDPVGSTAPRNRIP